MTIRTAFATILGCTVLIGAIGASIGYGLGTFVPSYYRSIFRDGRDPSFDPVGVGIGQGLTQGAAGGTMVGLAIIALFCWRDIRRQRLAGTTSTEGSRAGAAAPGTGTILLVTGVLFALPFCLLIGFMARSMAGSYGAFVDRYSEEAKVLTPALAGEPAFAEVGVQADTAHGGAFLAGDVQTRDDLERLRTTVAHVIGEARAKEMLIGIRVVKR